MYVAIWALKRFCAGVARMFQWVKNDALCAVIIVLLWISIPPIMVLVAIIMGPKAQEEPDSPARYMR